MLTRTTQRTLTFTHPLVLKDIGRTLPAGRYVVVTEEELVEDLSFPVYRRTSTTLLVPLPSLFVSSVEMLTVHPRDLQASLDQDAAMRQPSAGAHVHSGRWTSTISEREPESRAEPDGPTVHGSTI